MKTKMRKIGFVDYEESTEIIPEVAANNTSNLLEDEKDEKGLITPVHAEILETIKNLSEIITDKSFAKYSDVARTNFVIGLIRNVALNTELTVKTMLLMGK